MPKEAPPSPSFPRGNDEKATKLRLLPLAGQALAYLAFAAGIGYFAVRPLYQPLPPDQAVVKFALRHQGALKQECRQRSAEELASLPPNMRLAMDCPRERWPVQVELIANEMPLFEATLPPGGLSKDGASYAYHRFIVPAGSYRLAARLSDDGRPPADGIENTASRTLAAGEVLVVEFDTAHGRFVFH